MQSLGFSREHKYFQGVRQVGKNSAGYRGKGNVRQNNSSMRQYQETEGYGVYNNTNVAYDLEPQYYPEELPRERPYVREYTEQKRIRREQIKHRLKLFMALAFVFSCLLLTMVSYASVAEQRVNLNRMKDELAVMQNENIALQAEISEQVDLASIKKDATERLGMSEPQPYQIVYVEAPTQSYTVQYAAAEENKEEGFSLKSLFDILKKD